MGLGSTLQKLMKSIAVSTTTDKVSEIQEIIDPNKIYTQHDGYWDNDTDKAYKIWVTANADRLKSMGAKSGLDGLNAKELISNFPGLSGKSPLDKVHDLIVNKFDDQPDFFDTISQGIENVTSFFDEPEEVETLDTSNAADIIAQAYPNAASFAQKIVDVANNLGANPFDLANLINFESAGTFDASIKNRLGYTGLIQFGKGAAQDLNTTREDLANMSEEQQMDYVQAYFELPHKRRGADYSRPEELYMAVFYPAAINKNSGRVDPNYRFPKNVIKSNNGIATPNDYMQRAQRNARINRDRVLSEDYIRQIVMKSIIKELID